MPFISCTGCGANIDSRATVCSRCGGLPRPKYARAVAVLCNCASAALVLALVRSGPEVAPPPASLHSAQAVAPHAGTAPAPAARHWHLPCGDAQDCLAGSEFAYVPAPPRAR